ncbi:MAG TPA: hypothetical protein VMS71_00110 [Candidatus Acidoferrum sp.]|nr:hypothetical protein [Candidatus Acidoferrum sp.]
MIRPVQISAPAFRAGLWPSSSERHLPRMLTIGALKGPFLCHGNDTSFNLDGFAVNQCVRYLLVGRLENATKGRAGNIHPCSRILLIKTIEVGKPKGLELVNSQGDFLQLHERDSARLEKRGGGKIINKAGAFWSRHSSSPDS